MSLAFWDVTPFVNMRYGAGIIIVLCFPAQAFFSIVIVVKLTHMPPHLHGTNVQCLTVNNMD